MDTTPAFLVKDDYVTAALWSSHVDGEPADQFELSTDSYQALVERYKAHVAELDPEIVRRITEMDAWESFAHDLWLTCEGHGAGFWDGGWPVDLGEYLTKFSEDRRSDASFFIGDDGQLEVEGI